MNVTKPIRSDETLTEYLILFARGERIPLICPNCNTQFDRARKHVNEAIKNSKILYCSQSCGLIANHATKGHGSFHTRCLECDGTISRYKSTTYRNKPNHVFCNKSCSATYNNKHKTHGTRRSKLEIYLEYQINSTFPSLQLLCNDKSTIGSELDFYFPHLKFAIELNGIFHYEPIYGADKFSKIKLNDQQKFIACHNAGIELCIIDSSTCVHLNQNAKNKYWEIVSNLITNILPRLSG